MKAAADDISADVDRTGYVRCALAPTYRWHVAADLAGRRLSCHCLPGSGQVAEAINTLEQPSDQGSLRQPDGGNRTVSLPIRRFPYRHPAPFKSVRGGFGGVHSHFHSHAVFRKLQLIVFKRVRDSLSSSVATWAFSSHTHHDIQDHPVYIPRNLSPGQG